MKAGDEFRVKRLETITSMAHMNCDRELIPVTAGCVF